MAENENVPPLPPGAEIIPPLPKGAETVPDLPEGAEPVPDLPKGATVNAEKETSVPLLKQIKSQNAQAKTDANSLSPEEFQQKYFLPKPGMGELESMAGGAGSALLAVPQLLATQVGPNIMPEPVKEANDWIEQELAKTQKTLKDWSESKGDSFDAGKFFGTAATTLAGGEAVEAGLGALTKGAPFLAPAADVAGSGATAAEAGAAATETGAAATETGAATTAAVTAEKTSKIRSLLNALRDTAYSTGKGTASGAGYGSLNPRFEQEKEKRDAARWEDIKQYAKINAVVGGSIVGGGNVLKFLDYSWNELSPTSRQQAVDGVLKLMQNMQAEASGYFGGAAKLEEDRLKALKIAQDAGLTEEQANAYVQSATQGVLDAHNYAQQIAEDFKKLSKDAQSKTDFGEFSQKWLAKNQKEIEKARYERVGFADALDSAPEGHVVDLKEPTLDANGNDQSVKAFFDEYLPQFSGPEGPNTDTGRMLAAIKKQLGLVEEEVTTAEEGAESLLKSKKKATVGEPDEKGMISVKNANELRMEFNDMVRTRKLSSRYGITQPSDVQLKMLGEITERLNAAAGKVHPPYTKAVNNFRLESRPLDSYVSGGFQGLTDTDVTTGAVEATNAKITRSLLKMAREGDKDLAKALNSDPEFKEQARKYFLGELFGVGQSVQPVSEAKFLTFWKNNEELLDQAGLKDYFLKINEKHALGEAAKGVAEEGLSVAEQGQVKAKDLADQIAKVETAKAELEFIQKQVDTTPPEILAKNPEKIRTWLDKLGKPKDGKPIISLEKYGELAEQLNQIERDYAVTKNAQDFAKSVRYWLLAAVGTGTLGTTFGPGAYRAYFGTRGH